LSCQFLRSVLPAPELDSLRFQIAGAYEKAEAARQANGLIGINAVLPPNERFVPSASSFTLGAVLSENEVRKIFSCSEITKVLAAIRNKFGSSIVCDLSQSWIRRQYPPAQYPSMHAPHGWHQDGALGFDFMAHADGRFPADALLVMMTAWIALDSCGLEAPGLELLRIPIQALVPPSELSDNLIRGRFNTDSFWRPAMESGDALLFPGDILHRTHVTPHMTKTRTSLELRFFPENKIPARLKSDRFMQLD